MNTLFNKTDTVTLPVYGTVSPSSEEILLFSVHCFDSSFISDAKWWTHVSTVVTNRQKKTSALLLWYWMDSDLSNENIVSHNDDQFCACLQIHWKHTLLISVKQTLSILKTSSNFKFKLYNVVTFDPSHFFRTTITIYTSCPLSLELPTYLIIPNIHHLVFRNYSIIYSLTFVHHAFINCYYSYNLFYYQTFLQVAKIIYI